MGSARWLWDGVVNDRIALQQSATIDRRELTPMFLPGEKEAGQHGSLPGVVMLG